MPDLFSDAREAGFSDQEIGEWASGQRATWKQAGFTDDEINQAATGMKMPGQVPQPYINRLMGAAKEGFSAGFGSEPIGGGAEQQKAILDYVRPPDGAPLQLDGKIRYPVVYKAVEAMFRGVNAALMGAGATVGEAVNIGVGRESSDSESLRAREDWAHMAAITAILAGAHSPVKRGNYAGVDETVGHLPKSQDFTDAAKSVVEPTAAKAEVAPEKVVTPENVPRQGADVANDNATRPTPPETLYPAEGGPPVTVPGAAKEAPSLGNVRDKIIRLYEDHGIHPAEVAADAALDPKLKDELAASTPSLPERYVPRTTESTAANSVEIPETASERRSLLDNVNAQIKQKFELAKRLDDRRHGSHDEAKPEVSRLLEEVRNLNRRTYELAQAVDRDAGLGQGARTTLDQALEQIRPGRGIWADVPEGQIYLRSGHRFNIGKTLEIPNVEFRIGERGQGAFARYLDQIEPEAARRGYDAVYIEQIFNKRLPDFLRRRGYKLETGPIGARVGETPTMYKTVEGHAPKAEPAPSAEAPAVRITDAELTQRKADETVTINGKTATAGDEAFHASQHDFDRFDISKVGTGEGPQGSGYGIYLSEGKGTHDYYMEHLGQFEPTISYKVRVLADKDRFLDLDSQLSEMSPYVRERIKKLPGALTKYSEDPTGRAIFENLYAHHSNQVGEPNLFRTAEFEKRASDALRDAGIPGTKTLGEAADGKNLVVFDPRDIEITHKNGIPVEVPPTPKAGPAAKPAERQSLFEFLASKGGLRPNQEYARGDLQAILDGNPFVPGFGRLVRKDGMTWERAREAATEAGYIGGENSGQHGSTVIQFLDLMRDEAGGNKRYREGFEDTTTAKQRLAASEQNRVDIERAVDGFIEDAGLGPVDEKLHARAVQIMEKEGVAEPDVAFERAVMEDGERKPKLARDRREVIPEIPGWDVVEQGAAPRAGGALSAAEPGLGRVRQGEGAGAGEVSRGAGEGGAVERTAAGEQHVLPGAERISDAELAQRKADEGLRPTAAQKPMDIGLFGDESLQADLVDMARHSLGAAATATDAQLLATPPRPPGHAGAWFRSAAEKITDIWHDVQMRAVPMARGSRPAQAIAKEFADRLRLNRFEWARIDSEIEKRFDPEQRKRMWDAADEESVARQLGESTEHQGLVTLTGEERAMVEKLQSASQATWLILRDMGMVQGEGLPAYTPRMLINVANAVGGEAPRSLNSMGANLRTRTAQMLHRSHMTAEETEAAARAKFGEEAQIVRDIRTLPLATARLEDAIAGRAFINDIREVGRQSGSDTVAEGFRPQDSESSWFTIDHPAFRTWRPKFKENAETGKIEAVKDAVGNIVFEQTPIYVRGDFEGPVRAVLSQQHGALYNAFMEMKAKTMSLIMLSPMIHNAVEYGRAFPTMPGKMLTLRVYRDGAVALADPVAMREAIEHGFAPIGRRGFNQDISSIAEAPQLQPGRSLTARVLAFIPDLFDPRAGDAVKRKIDQAGDFWHNTLLWDQIAKLQAGIYVNARDAMIRERGIDPDSAQWVAAHMANRYAGALPQEAMSHGARVIGNSLLFSRTFTLGNLGVMKDMFTGLPRDVLASIERESGPLNPQAVDYAKSIARRKAISAVVMDVALFYVVNSLLQSAVNVVSGYRDLPEEGKRYAERFGEAMQMVGEHPLKVLQPFSLLEHISATSENEPGKQDRVFVGTTKDGQAIYMRNPFGKIGEEFLGWAATPLEMLRKKEGTVARPAFQLLSNDAGFGRKVYNPHADTIDEYWHNAARIVGHLAAAQTPEGQIRAAKDLATGQGDQKLAAAQTFGPFAGLTFSRGAPGGPAVGELYRSQEMHRYFVNEALPDIRRQIQNGELGAAYAKMQQLGIPRGLQNFYVRTTVAPQTRLGGRTVKDFYLYATPDQRERFERALQQQR